MSSSPRVSKFCSRVSRSNLAEIHRLIPKNSLNSFCSAWLRLIAILRDPPAVSTGRYFDAGAHAERRRKDSRTVRWLSALLQFGDNARRRLWRSVPVAGRVKSIWRLPTRLPGARKYSNACIRFLLMSWRV